MPEHTTPAGLVRLLLARPRGHRTILAIAGPPGAGKSHLAEVLRRGIDAVAPGRAAVVPMDGFHLDDDTLRARRRLGRKGAPDTFDVAGMRRVLGRLRDPHRPEVRVPTFDRAGEVTEAGARLIPPAADIVITEGNYLLVEEPPWTSLGAYVDLTVMLDAPPDRLRERLMARWREHGVPEEKARERVIENDLPNGEFVVARSRPADYVVAT